MPKGTFEQLVEVMHELRQKCPWDREQTFESLRQYVLEEAYEVADAMDEVEKQPAPTGAGSQALAKGPAKLADELGDLLFQVVFQAELAKERGWFDEGDVCGGIREKLVRRHPHVFGEVEAKTAGDVLRNWEAIKADERKGEGATSAIDGVPRALPSLLRAEKIGKRAARAGFDWPDVEGVLKKVEEEIREIRAALAAKDEKAAAAELGDLFFAAAQLGRFLHANPEESSRAAVDKFEARFRHMESSLAARGKKPADVDDAELDRLWEDAKKALGR